MFDKGGLHIDEKIVGLMISQWLPCPRAIWNLLFGMAILLNLVKLSSGILTFTNGHRQYTGKYYLQPVEHLIIIMYYYIIIILLLLYFYYIKNNNPSHCKTYCSKWESKCIIET